MDTTAGIGLTILRVLLWVLVPPALLLLHGGDLLSQLTPGKQERGRVEPTTADPG